MKAETCMLSRGGCDQLFEALHGYCQRACPLLQYHILEEPSCWENSTLMFPGTDQADMGSRAKAC